MAIDRRSIRVHADLVAWLEEERRKSKTGSISDLRNKLKEEQHRVAELEAALADKNRETATALYGLLKENALLKEAALAIEDLPYTLWRKVLAMLREGKKDKEIAEKLYDKGQGLSKSQLGALLYTGREELPAAKTLQDYGGKLLR